MSRMKRCLRFRTMDFFICGWSGAAEEGNGALLTGLAERLRPRAVSRAARTQVRFGPPTAGVELD